MPRHLTTDRRARITGRIALGLLFLALSLSFSQPVAAAPAKDVARLHFQQAEKAYKLGHYIEAIREYEAAYAALPEPAFLFNIAQSHRQQYQLDHEPEHLQKALVLYKSYLREAQDPPNRETVVKLIDELKELLSAVEQRAEQQRPGTLIVHGQDQAIGADARIDGKLAGQVPLKQEVSPGGHFVQVDKAGFTQWSATVSVPSGGEVALDVKLLPLTTPSTSEEARPFYKSWWFWTAVGVAVAAGAGTGIYLGTRSSDSGEAIRTIDLR